MSKIIITSVFLILCSAEVKSQDFMSVYNLSKNENRSNRNYSENFEYDGFGQKKKPNRFGKILIYTGILAGGLMLADQATKQDYFIGNSTIYGVGGIMTLLSTGLIISSVNGINKNLFVSVKREGLTMCLAIK